MLFSFPFFRVTGSHGQYVIYKTGYTQFSLRFPLGSDILGRNMRRVYKGCLCADGYVSGESAQCIVSVCCFLTWAFLKRFPSLNPLPNDKIFDMYKLKGFADDKIDIAKMIVSFFDRVENTVGKAASCLEKFIMLGTDERKFWKAWIGRRASDITEIVLKWW